MESGAISKQLNSVWRRAGVYQDMKVAPKRNMTTTMFRKSISTAVLEHNRSASTEVANLLAHSEKTQRKYYNARRMDLSTARGASHVSSLLRYCKKGVEMSSACTDVVASSPKKQWSKAEIDEIKKLFPDEVLSGIVSKELIEERRDSFVNLQTVPCQKIFEKIMSIKRYGDRDTPTKDPKELPVEDDYKKVSRVNPENPDCYPSSLSGVGSTCTGVEKVFEP